MLRDNTDRSSVFCTVCVPIKVGNALYHASLSLARHQADRKLNINQSIINVPLSPIDTKKKTEGNRRRN